jgi:hypothetical protein
MKVWEAARSGPTCKIEAEQLHARPFQYRHFGHCVRVAGHACRIQQSYFAQEARDGMSSIESLYGNLRR